MSWPAGVELNQPSQRPWTPLSLFTSRFEANVRALEGRESWLARQLLGYQPTQTYCIQTSESNIVLATHTCQSIVSLPQTLPPAKAIAAVAQLYPVGKYNKPLLIAGEDLGWLCNRVYQLPNESFQSHQHPIFFVMPDLERFWVMLHIQDWQTLLADARVRLFVGNGAVQRFKTSLLEDVTTPWPTASVTVEGAQFAAEDSPTEILKQASAELEKTREQLAAKARELFANRDAQSFITKIRSGKPLNVMGICTRHSVFVRYSLSDWLAAFKRLGHRTQLVTESADYQLVNIDAVSRALVDFKPDLVLMINHFRTEMSVVPEQIPFVMWAQDWCENITNRSAAAAQGPMDFVLGHNPMRMKRAFGYPLARYMAAVVPVNDDRFYPRTLSAEDSAKYACDVSFVSNASTPARKILEDEIRKVSAPEFASAMRKIYDELESIYTNGGSITQVQAIQTIIEQVLKASGLTLREQELSALLDFFSHHINSALFRHQSLYWLADAGIDLRLFGRGWENHPRLGKFARGVADNHTQLAMVYQASKINLQISPHGVMHQRVFEGLLAGGFFLFRHCDGDVVGKLYKAVWEWCKEAQIASDAEMLDRAPQEIKDKIEQISRLLKRDLFIRPRASFLEYLKYQAANAYLDNVDLLWESEYPAVAFNSQEDLVSKVQYFLTNPQQRQITMEAMRQPVMRRYTYRATVDRLMRFLANDLTRQIQAKSRPPAKAAA